MTCSDFIFRMPTGEEVMRSRDMKGFKKALKEVPIESIEYHQKNKHFSPWLLDHKNGGLAKKIERMKATGENLRKSLIKAV